MLSIEFPQGSIFSIFYNIIHEEKWVRSNTHLNSIKLVFKEN